MAQRPVPGAAAMGGAEAILGNSVDYADSGRAVAAVSGALINPHLFLTEGGEVTRLSTRRIAKAVLVGADQSLMLQAPGDLDGLPSWCSVQAASR
jgi:hypothetical protein